MMGENTKFTIEIELPQAPIEEAARAALSGLLGTPRRVDARGGEGYEIIKSKIADHIQNAEIAPLIEAQLESAVRGVVDEVLGDVLTSVVRARVNELKRDGTLGAMAAKMLPSLTVQETGGKETDG